MKALNPLACYAFGNVYFSTLFTRKVIYGFSFFLHGKKILKIQLMIRLHILWSSWSSPSCKKSLLLSLCKKFVIFVSYCTAFSNSGFCHLGVNFFVFCRNLKTKTDLKSLCNFQIECGISKDLMIKFLPKIKKMLFFSVFDLIFLRVFSFLSVKNMIFLV